MNLFELFAKVSLDTSEYEKGVSSAKQSGQGLANSLKSMMSGVSSVGSGVVKMGNQVMSVGKTAFQGITTGATAFVGAVTAVGGALLSLEASTEEYRVAQGKLNTAYEAVGYSVETAKEAYTAFYGILGDTDTATEASQLLAKLTENEKDISTWTDIAAGVMGTFGDSLPIEGLIESANETAKVGQVTGSLADALNWAGISEDEFNAKLEACTSESERNRLIMKTLSSTYDEASDAFYRNNEELVKARENQVKLDDAMANLGTTISKIKNGLVSEFLPSVAQVVESFNKLLQGTDGASESFAAAVEELVAKGVKKLPELISFGSDIIFAVASGIMSNAGQIITALSDAIVSALSSIEQNGESIAQAGNTVIRFLSSGFSNIVDAALGLVDDLITTVVFGIKQYVEVLFTTGMEVIAALVSGIADNIDEIVYLGYELLTEIAWSIKENLPVIVDAAADIVVGLIDGISEALPDLAELAFDIANTIGTSLAENAPKILEAGMNLISQLASGIESGLPDMVAKLPQIIEGFVGFITENLPTILDQGTEIILSLMHGILDAIPEFVNGLPQIITAFVSFITENLPKIVSAGVEILTSLVLGIIQNIPELVAALPQIISAIVTGIKNLLGSIVDVGKAIVEGIWQGITNAAGWLTSKITGWFNGVVDGVKSFLGIASPSKVFAGIGKNMALGVGEGWGDEFGRIKRDIEGGLDFGTARVDWASSGMAQSQRGLSSALQSVAASVGENINIVVQSVLDGKVIGETSYKYIRNKERAYGV